MFLEKVPEGKENPSGQTYRFELIDNKKSSEIEISDEQKEEILKEYAEDLYQEFNQVARVEGKITMKDVEDILQI